MQILSTQHVRRNSGKNGKISLLRKAQVDENDADDRFRTDSEIWQKPGNSEFVFGFFAQRSEKRISPVARWWQWPMTCNYGGIFSTKSRWRMMDKQTYCSVHERARGASIFRCNYVMSRINKVINTASASQILLH